MPYKCSIFTYNSRVVTLCPCLLHNSPCKKKKWREIGESSVRGGRRVTSKNCDFCNFCDFSKNCEKLEKSQFLLKLTKSRVRGDKRVPGAHQMEPPSPLIS